jgi:YfiH family protein
LNFSVRRGDTPERVRENRARFAAAVQVEPSHVVSCRQVHGNGVAKADWNNAGQVVEGVDALITNQAGLPLSLVFADCVPILLYDPTNHVLGVCHAGWRGTVNGAGVATLRAMRAAYQTDPGDTVACIGPSIGPKSYEVGEDVVALAHAKLANPERYFAYPNGDERQPHFDLWQANAGQLEEAGVAVSRIEFGGIDTAQQIDEFFSHRAESGRCGLFGLLAWLAPGQEVVGRSQS